MQDLCIKYTYHKGLQQVLQQSYRSDMDKTARDGNCVPHMYLDHDAMLDLRVQSSSHCPCLLGLVADDVCSDTLNSSASIDTGHSFPKSLSSAVPARL